MDYRETSRLSANPPAIRLCAKTIRAAAGNELSEWELNFLDAMENFAGNEMLSVRQQETLHELRSKVSRRTVVKGFRASTLIKRLWELRLDLSEESEIFICNLANELPDDCNNLALSDAQWRYLFAVAREAGEIEQYISIG